MRANAATIESLLESGNLGALVTGLTPSGKTAVEAIVYLTQLRVKGGYVKKTSEDESEINGNVLDLLSSRRLRDVGCQD